MIVLVDIGNSNIVLSMYDGKINETYRYKTDPSKSIDEYYIILKDILKNAKGIIISSVVPELNVIFKNLSIKYLNIENPKRKEGNIKKTLYRLVHTSEKTMHTSDIF